jgi:hypothetical protein
MEPEGSLQCSRPRHWSLSGGRWIQSTSSDHISLRYIRVLSSHLQLDPQGGVFPTIEFYVFLISPLRATYPANPTPIWFNHPNKRVSARWCSSFGIETDYGLDDRGSIPGGGWEFFFFDTVSRPALGPKPPIQWVPGALFLWLKPPVREADHSPPSSAEVKECVELYLQSPNTSPWRGA